MFELLLPVLTVPDKAEVEKVTLPALLAMQLNVKTWNDPAVILALAGVAAEQVALPVPVLDRTLGVVKLAVALPAFVTLKLTVMAWPTVTVDGAADRVPES